MKNFILLDGKLLVVMASVGLFPACGQSSYGTAGTSTSMAVTLEALPAGNATNGQTEFATSCSSCHGSTGMGGSGPVIRGAASSSIQSAVRSGVGAMPAFSTTTLSDQALADIIAYLN